MGTLAESALVDPVSGTSSPYTMSTKTARASMIPDLFTQLPPCRDLLMTESSQDQDETIQKWSTTITECPGWPGIDILPFCTRVWEGFQPAMLLPTLADRGCSTGL